MLTEDVAMTHLQVSKLFVLTDTRIPLRPDPSEGALRMRGRRQWVIAAALCCLAASCGSEPEAQVTSQPPATTLAVAGPQKSEDSPHKEIDEPQIQRIDPKNWDEIPDWWPEVQDVPMERLVKQNTKWVETTPSDRQASEMHLGDRVLKWRIPGDWVEHCMAHNACSYGPDEDNPGTKGFVVGWGGTKPRTWASDPASNGRELRWANPLTYVEGETQPLDCETNQELGDREALDRYPEPWFVGCVRTINEFTTARVEMFRLNDDCEPYGNSYGAWIGWENAHRSNVDIFVETLAIQMLADRIECVTTETLLAQGHGNWVESWVVSTSSLSTIDRFAAERGSAYPAIWVTELQRRIGAQPDGIYGTQTQELHYQAAKDQKPRPLVPLISSGPCGTFKLDVSKWPFGPKMWISLKGAWVEKDNALRDPPGIVHPWWSVFGDQPNPGTLVPPPPDWIDTADVTGDGVEDFIFRWQGSIHTTAVVVTNHKAGSSCGHYNSVWRYVGDGAFSLPLYTRLYAERHDYWNVSYKSYGDSQGGDCYLNQSYAWYDPYFDTFEPTVCEIP